MLPHMLQNQPKLLPVPPQHQCALPLPPTTESPDSDAPTSTKSLPDSDATIPASVATAHATFLHLSVQANQHASPLAIHHAKMLAIQHANFLAQATHLSLAQINDHGEFLHRSSQLGQSFERTSQISQSSQMKN